MERSDHVCRAEPGRARDRGRHGQVDDEADLLPGVLPGLRGGAVVGAGAVVTKDVDDFAIVAGLPAKLIRYRFDAQTINNLTEIKWWDQSDHWMQRNVNLMLNIDDITYALKNDKSYNH